VATRTVKVDTVRPLDPSGTMYGVTFSEYVPDGQASKGAVTLAIAVPLSEAETMSIGKQYTLTLEEVTE